MSEVLRYYFDEHLDPDIAPRLRMRGIDAITAKELGYAGKEIPNPIQLAYATEQDRVIITKDWGFVDLSDRQYPHAGIIMLQRLLSTGKYVEYLELFALTIAPEMMRNQLIFCDWE